MHIRAGASGFAYKPWKGPFYPADLKDAEMLRYYGERLPAVEINNTFYRIPKRTVLEAWAAEVPAGFHFAFKASRRITHMKRLKECEEPLSYLLTNLATLGPRLGPLLFQLPPNLKADLDRLNRFMDLLPEGGRTAFEFRHPSWFEPPVIDALRARGIPLCFVERENAEGDDEALEVPFVATGDYGFLRLRKDDYTDDELTAWLARIRAEPWSDAYVFFKHEDSGVAPRVAARFLELAAG